MNFLFLLHSAFILFVRFCSQGWDLGVVFCVKSTGFFKNISH